MSTGSVGLSTSFMSTIRNGALNSKGLDAAVLVLVMPIIIASPFLVQRIGPLMTLLASLPIFFALSTLSLCALDTKFFCQLEAAVVIFTPALRTFTLLFVLDDAALENVMHSMHFGPWVRAGIACIFFSLAVVHGCLPRSITWRVSVAVAGTALEVLGCCLLISFRPVVSWDDFETGRVRMLSIWPGITCGLMLSAAYSTTEDSEVVPMEVLKEVTPPSIVNVVVAPPLASPLWAPPPSAAPPSAAPPSPVQSPSLGDYTQGPMGVLDPLAFSLNDSSPSRTSSSSGWGSASASDSEDYAVEV
mmetsp:Transcript_1526/g.4324  ORF Transcript_1526/g.4324 Transcript_1526/m.4324 type:complete len:303 (+) Transcript_1526:165-1073(+)|eukprot:CAMPEP_0115853168 /NCGR_PEP_ID=MMETSP0287-20121206/13366_1 /TAXON_ID=412157 /ORGANISM="Chrysochromulina rotalis, Strain UIO044" /LENGTH=302 /DNA_ID=CAMNT_0003307239 /DNA_START=137 /DNA_END=1045 /DNA_ORIENTATION=-